MRIRSALSHVAQAVLEGLLIALLVVGLMAGTAFAGKSGGSATSGGKHPVSGGTFSVKMVNDQNGNGGPNWGDTITYDLSKVTVQNPFITTTCTQGKTSVLSTWAGYYDAYLWPAAQNILLKTEYWTGGSATCTAVLSNTTTKLVFTVGA
jgi:hypothetical protein